MLSKYGQWNSNLFSDSLSGRGRTRMTSLPNQSRVPLGVLSWIDREAAMFWIVESLKFVKFLRNRGPEGDVADVR
jgi:hypothetical protein